MLLKVIAIIIILGAFLSYPGYMEVRKYNRRIAELDEEIKSLEQTNKDLQLEIEALKNNPFYIEKVVRENLGLVKPGEIIYRIIPEENSGRGVEQSGSSSGS